MRNISPSIIAGDFSKLDREIKEIEDLALIQKEKAEAAEED